MKSTENITIPVWKISLTVVYLLLFPVIIFVLSGDWSWVEGWIFAIWFMALCISAIAYLYKHDQALLAERYKQPGSANQKGWDRLLIKGFMVVAFLWFVIMPLDAKRLAWTVNFPLWWKVIGFVLLLPSFFLFYRSYTDNTYLSPLVRIQEERKHKTISTGVYGFVRHPMYLGSVFFFLGTPLLLGSTYGVVLGAVLTFFLVARIIGEEKTLTEELDGYSEYKNKVKYRLIPYIW